MSEMHRNLNFLALLEHLTRVEVFSCFFNPYFLVVIAQNRLITDGFLSYTEPSRHRGIQGGNKGSRGLHAAESMHLLLDF